uniref:FBA_2 domain-containing protein n=1 Tax=Caenorhabditis tropicalis TaxID=1561998 RepID=A0A1I7T2X8_9PELO
MHCLPKKGMLEVIITKRNGLTVPLDFGRHWLIEVLEISEMPEDRILEKGKIGNSVVSMEMGRVGCLKTYWNDRKFGIKEVATYGMEVFGKPIESLGTTTQTSNDEPIWILDWINSFQKPLLKCYCSSNGEMSDENITYFLKNCNVTDQFLIGFTPTDQFQIDSIRSVEMSYLSITPSKWFTRDLLLSINTKSIFLTKSSLSSKDIKSFLHHWINGGCPKLKEIFVCINVNRMNYNEILEGIEVDQSDTHLVREYVRADSVRLSIRGRFDIKNGNETTATILRDHAGPNAFKMVVWSESTDEIPRKYDILN